MATANKAAAKHTAASAPAKKPAAKATAGTTGNDGAKTGKAAAKDSQSKAKGAAATSGKAPARKSAAATSKVKASDSGKGGADGAAPRKPNAAFMKALTPSPELAAIVGEEPLPRTEVVKQMWVYIKAHDLQDAANKRLINADDKLEKVFGKPQVNMFEMTGLLSKHLT